MSRNIPRGSQALHLVKPCHIIIFPLTSRIGKIRDVASKLIEKSTERHAEYYRTQVSDALFKQLAKIGLPDTEQDEQVGAFFSAVDVEVARLMYRQNNPGGRSA